MSESVNKNLGHATAYGYAKAKGYTGTEEEFAELMASYGTVAQSAAASASAAAQAKTDAEAALEAAEEAEAGAKEAERSVEDKALTAIQGIETAGEEQVTGIRQAGADQVEAVETAGGEQVDAVEQKGAEVRQSIPEEYTELSEDVTELKSAANNKLNGDSLNWVIGGLNLTTGAAMDRDTRIRTEYISVETGTVITDSVSNLSVFRYGEDKSYLGYEDWTGSYTVASGTKFVRLVLRKDSNNSTISPSDIDDIAETVNIEFVTPIWLYNSSAKQKEIDSMLSAAGMYEKASMTNGKKVALSGDVVDDSLASATDYIPVTENTVIILKNLFLSGARAVIVYDSSKVKLATAAYNDGSITAMTYTIPKGGAYIRATGWTEINVEYILFTRNTFNNFVPKIISETIAAEYTNGYVKYTDGSISTISTYKYSDPIYLHKGTLTVRCAGSSGVAVISSTDEEGTTHTPLVEGTGTTLDVYTYTVQNEGYYCVSYRVENGTPAITLDRNCISTVIDNFNSIQVMKKDLPQEEQFTPSFIENKFVNWALGKISSSTNYSITKPIYLPKGTLVVNAQAGSDTSVISRTNADVTYGKCLVRGESSSEVKTYTYQVTEPGFFTVSDRKSGKVRITFTYSVNDRFDAEEALESNRPHDKEVLKGYRKTSAGKNLSIKAYKVITFEDGTEPKYSQVLWNDPSDDSYYISADIHAARTKVFDWDTELADGISSDMYQAVILKNGDVLFVYQTQFDNPNDNTGDGGQYRRNPIIYLAERDFEPQEIDFGENTKPTGWLQNCGALYSYHHNRLYIAEYTRINEAHAHAWVVDMPVTTVSNWHAVLREDISRTDSSAYQAGFKHFHTVQEDPYTNIIYFSSGDNLANSHLWYSTDGGDTLTEAYGSPNDGKFRMLNMAFTEDYVYWATDDWSPTHLLWRCSRIESNDSMNGVLDTENGLTKLLTFTDEAGYDGTYNIATYANIYLPMYNAILFLDRDDGGKNTRLPVRVYDIDTGTLYTAGYVYPYNHAAGTILQFGFRNVSVLCNPRSNEVPVSFNAKHNNNIKLFGNASYENTKINNLILRVYKNGSGYSITFDTLL